MPPYDQSVVFLYRCFLGYLGLGTAFAAAFVVFGVQKIDAEAEKSGIGFRAMIFPGAVALWPILFRRWVQTAQPPTERNAHRCSVR